MATRMARALLASVLLGAVPGARCEATCGGDGGSVACAAGEVADDSSLLALRGQEGHLRLQAQAVCSDSPGVFCAGNQCCPGVAISGGKTFPCSSADKGFDGCETGPPVIPTPAPRPPVVDVQCPGSGPHVMCARNQCCPGVSATKGKTFPCVTADASFNGCEAGQEATVLALLSAFTKEEKYSWLRGVGWTNGTWDTMPGFYVGDVGFDPNATGPGLYERFGVPALNMMDNGQGFRTLTMEMYPEVTSWPVTLTVASSWNEDATRRWGEALGEEFRAKGSNVILGPGLNVHRVALGGRNAEYVSGESGYLGARLAKPWVQAVQSKRVLGVMKHFVNNNQETDRSNYDAIVDNRTLFEVYYPPFEAAVDADVASAMCGYNVVNGEHACGNPTILNADLRDQMGFKGFVMSDWWALHDFAAPMVNQELPGDATPENGQYYTKANLDTLSNETIDSMVRPILSYMLKYGLMESEGQVCQPGDGTGCNHQLYEVVAKTPEHEALNLELATAGVLLLKNEGEILPLKAFKGLKKVMLLGSACNASQDYAGQALEWDLGSMYNIGGSGRVVAWQPVSIYAGLRAKLEEHGVELVFDFEDGAGSAPDIDLQAPPDVVFVCGFTTSTEGKDRVNLSVDQEDFMMKVTKVVGDLNIPVVSLTVSPGAILMPWHERVKAIVNVFQAGSQTGRAFADVLWGDHNPSAKSPITFPLSVKDTILPCGGLRAPTPLTQAIASDAILPADGHVLKGLKGASRPHFEERHVPCPYSEGLFAGFPHYEGMEVLFPFGHGLSYTKFKYSGLQVCATPNCLHACAGAKVCVTGKLTNVGGYVGAEVAQLYLGYPEGLGEPAKLLRGFNRIEDLAPGAAADLSFPLSERDLQIYSNELSKWVTPVGSYKVYVGTSSRDAASLEGGFVLGAGRQLRPPWTTTPA